MSTASPFRRPTSHHTLGLLAVCGAVLCFSVSSSIVKWATPSAFSPETSVISKAWRVAVLLVPPDSTRRANSST